MLLTWALLWERGLPVVGWAIVASDISQIVYKTVRDYNTIAHEKDRIW
jgi:hypothetical protein